MPSDSSVRSPDRPSIRYASSWRPLMAPSAAVASCAVHGARCGFLRCGMVMRRRNGRSSMSSSSYADACTVAFTSPCVILDGGTCPMAGRTFRTIWESYCLSVAAPRLGSSCARGGFSVHCLQSP